MKRTFVLIVLTAILAMLAVSVYQNKPIGDTDIVIYPTYGTSQPRPTTTATLTPVVIVIYPTKHATNIPMTKTPTPMLSTDGTVVSISNQ